MIEDEINLRGQEIRTFQLEFEGERSAESAFLQLGVTSQKRNKRARCKDLKCARRSV